MDYKETDIKISVLGKPVKTVTLNLPIPPKIKVIDLLYDIYMKASEGREFPLSYLLCLICREVGNDYRAFIDFSRRGTRIYRLSYPRDMEELRSHLDKLIKASQRSEYSKEIYDMATRLFQYSDLFVYSDQKEMSEYVAVISDAYEENWTEDDVERWNFGGNDKVAEEVDIVVKYVLPGGKEGDITVSYDNLDGVTYWNVLRTAVPAINEDTKLPELYFMLCPMQTWNSIDGYMSVNLDDNVEIFKGDEPVIYLGTKNDQAKDILDWVKSFSKLRKLNTKELLSTKKQSIVIDILYEDIMKYESENKPIERLYNVIKAVEDIRENL